MRALAMTGTVTATLIASIIEGSLMRATPPSRRMSAGTRSSAMTETAPASSAILACSGVTTSMITPPRSISARPRLTRSVPVVRSAMALMVVGGSGPASGVGRGHRGSRRGQLDPGRAGCEPNLLARRVGVGGDRRRRALRPRRLADLSLAVDERRPAAGHVGRRHGVARRVAGAGEVAVRDDLHDDV